MGDAFIFGLVLLDTVVPGLVSDLGHPRFQRREAAQAALRELAPMAAPRLERAKRHADPEVAYRADRLLSEFHALRAEYLAPRLLPTGYPCLPWIDMLPSEHAGRDSAVRTYLELARVEGQTATGSGWPNYRRATFFYVRDMLGQGMTPEDVVQLLDQMAAQEKAWIDRNRHNINLPVPRQQP